MELKSLKDPYITTSKSIRFMDEDYRDQDELVDTYKELLRNHIKSEKAPKKALESIDEEDKELSVYKK